MSKFCHLHNHFETSVLDGLSTVKSMVSRVAHLGQPAMAITDHGSMHGVVDFYRECKKQNIKPIIGCELYITNFGIDMSLKEANTREYNHLLLLARDQVGYKNLLQLSSIGWLEGFYYKPRIDYSVLEKHANGIIATSGCMASGIPSLILDNAPQKEIDALTDWYKSVFGENFYIELQHHDGIDEIVSLNQKLISLANKHGIKMIATNDAHYANPEDTDAHDTLLCIQTKSLKSTPKEQRFAFSDDGYYLKSLEEMQQAFAPYGLDDSIFTNTIDIMEMCDANPDEPSGKYHMPPYDVRAIGDFDNYNDALRELTYRHMVDRFGPSWEMNDIVKNRVEEELDVIEKSGFAQYYLIVYDLLDYARRNNIVWNVRGSGTGSYICYALGMSFIDPIKNKLLMSRFINLARVSMPDLDLDFPDSRRGEMVQYIIDKYGEDRVAQIATFSRMKARMVVRDVARAYGYTPEQSDVIAKQIPNIPGKPITIADSLNIDGEYPSPDLIASYENSEEARIMLDNGIKLENTIRQVGVHAAAVIISDKPLVEYTGLMRPPGNSITKHITQLDYPTLESLGLLKVDCLGLATMSIMDEACKLINERHGTSYTPFNVPFEDERSAFELLASGETMGIFQVESQGLRNALMSMRPDRFQHIMDAISLYRPGPIAHIPEYIERRHGNESIDYTHSVLEKHIDDTQGILIYQEQIISILSDLAGYTQGEADIVRKGISKKDPAVIDKNRNKFIQGCFDTYHIEQEIAEEIWNDIEKFAGYGFNRCLTGDTNVYLFSYSGNYIKSVTVEDLFKMLGKGKAAGNNLDYVILSYNHETNAMFPNRVIGVYETGFRQVYKITLESGETIASTKNHRHLSDNGYKSVGELKIGDNLYVSNVLSGAIPLVSKITSIVFAGYDQTYDIEMNGPNHNFLANGIITHNSHAASYARITMQTAYLKANYPIEYMTACLIVEGQKYDKIAGYISECKRMGIDVLPPDINLSKFGFSITPGKNKAIQTSTFPYPVNKNEVIRFGISSIKNVGDSAAKKIAEQSSINTLDDILKIGSLDINRKGFESLVYAGAFNSVYANKRELIYNADIILEQSRKASVILHGGQNTLFAPKLHLIHKEADVDLSAKEFEAIGTWIGEHPVKAYDEILPMIPHRISDVNEENVGEQITVIAVAVEISKSFDKQSKPMAFLKLSDMTGVCDAIVFSKEYKDIPEGSVIAVKGTVRMTNSQQVPTLIINKLNTNLVFARRKQSAVEPDPVSESNNAEQLSTCDELIYMVKLFSNELPDKFEHMLIESPGKTLAVYIYDNGNPVGVKRYRNKGIYSNVAKQIGTVGHR